MNSRTGNATREQILDVALDCIQREGLASLTTRLIAERAGVNVAAVNYHFGSKEALINEVLIVLTTGLRNAFMRLADRDTSPRERLHRFLDELSVALQQHPDVYRQALAMGMFSGDAHQQYLGFLRSEGLASLRRTVREATGEADSQKLTLRVIQAIGGLAYPLLVGAFLADATGIRLSDPEVRRRHVEVCLESLAPRHRDDD